MLSYHFQLIIPNFLIRNEPVRPTRPRADRPAGGSALSNAAQAAGPGRARRLDARYRSPLIESIALPRNRRARSSRLVAAGHRWAGQCCDGRPTAASRKLCASRFRGNTIDSIGRDRHRASNLRARPGPAAGATSERPLPPAGRSARGRVGRTGSFRIRKLGIMSWK